MTFLLGTVGTRRAQAQSSNTLMDATGSAGAAKGGASLLAGTAGDLYAATLNGGFSSDGTVLNTGAAGSGIVLRAFPGGNEGQAPQAADAGAPQRASETVPEGWGRVGAGVRVSTLGAGGEVAVEVTHTTNLRGGFNFFSYSRGYDNNGVHYAGDLRWASAEAHFDWFPFAHAFHLSPGLMIYNDNHVDATATVAGGQSFTLNHTDYLSNPADPVNGTAKLDFNKVAPTLMIGLGNLVPRNGKHFTFNVEVGVAFQGSPRINLNLAGSACAPGGINCQDVATTPSIQTNVQGEQTKITNDLSPFKYYPILSMTIGYRF